MKVFLKQKRTFYLKQVKTIRVKVAAFFDRLFFALNVLFSGALLLSCFVPFISFDKAPIVAFFSLGIPILVFVNLLFLLFWLIRRKKQLFLSLVVLVISYFSLTSFFMFRFSEDKTETEDLRVMTFNVRGFNKNEEIKNPNVFEETINLIKSENPDIICFQEFNFRNRDDFPAYKYKYLKYINNQGKVTLAIYSKYPIIKGGLVNFPESPNNGSFVDVLYRNDTLRVYNLHLESLRIIPDKDALAKEQSAKLFKRVAHSFKKQQEQAEIVRAHSALIPYKTIICGDFNGTQYSNVYKTIKGEDLQDTFQEKGTGYGRTYNFKYYPFRIDFILADNRLEVVTHKNFDVKLSDHFPVVASFRW